jgi:ribosomal protein L29
MEYKMPKKLRELNKKQDEEIHFLRLEAKTEYFEEIYEMGYRHSTESSKLIKELVYAKKI